MMNELLKNLKTVAIIGCSANKYRTSYHIANYLKENGIRIFPVNPNYEQVLGVECHSSLDEIPEDPTIDLVDIFRNSDYTADMVRDIIAWSEKTGQKPTIWTQLDVSTDEAKSLAENARFEYIENECLMVQHKKLVS
ncbi:CoA-binding protein [Aliifodinibius salipaludis]|uniref:CoA-binding protein n=1 Tax=Fodinibius salipaludis TaxID=2032627 RepID=A0A2A2G7W4_9BACT|nr:CoA-binding protein [Aliifodinibius salipaludis]PAU92927.1 CoA-binding protein [Aliifodinibius salipaludis]